ncbi:MAG: hypothetical protein KBS41_01460, partial [Oscillospiraceae bacterium]|nr:hypothetical protein [Candidatus Equicaccousia limihippi]
NAGQRAARMDDTTPYTGSKVYFNYEGGAGFIIDFNAGTTRGVSRQIQLTAGKSYTFSFMFKGQTKGFKIAALDAITDAHVSDGDNLITKSNDDVSVSHGLGSSTDKTDKSCWTEVEIRFTMPDDKSVANFVLGEGDAFVAAFDNFLLYESEPIIPEPVINNVWAVKGAPDQCGMEKYNDGYFSGEGTVERKNYIYGQTSKEDPTPKYNVSTYGWRGYGIKAAAANERMARMDDSGGIYCNKNGTAGLMVQFHGAVRGGSRQIQLEAGKTYTFEFWFKGYTQNFDVKALSAITNQHESDGDSLITYISHDLSSTTNDFSNTSGTTPTWGYITVIFTMPADKSVANFILGEGDNCEAAYDDFLLYESEPIWLTSASVSINGHYAYDTFNYGNAATTSANYIAKGGDVTLTATPADGYTFDGWYVGGTKVSSEASYVATPTADTKYIANFTYDGEVNYWADGDMETLSAKYSYIGNNITNGKNEDGWLTHNLSNYSPVRAVADENPYTGTYSLKLDFGGAVRTLGRRFKLQNNHSYTLTFWGKGNGNGFAIFNHNSATTEFTPSAKDEGVCTMQGLRLVFAKPYNAEWTQYSYTFTLSEGDYVDIAWCSISAYWIDDVTLTDHTHTWGDLVEETNSTCTARGNLAHYICSECNGVADENMVPTNWNHIEKAMLEHDIYAVEGIDPDCTNEGMEAHYACHNCTALFSDEEGETVVDAAALVIPANGHDFEYQEEVDPGCTECGQIEYYKCSVCELCVTDDSDPENTVIDEEDTYTYCYHGNEEVLKEQPRYKSAVVPTVDTDGNYEYFYCPSCGKCSFDVNFPADKTFKFGNRTKAFDLSDLDNCGAKWTTDTPMEYGNLSFDGDIGLNLMLDIDGYGLDDPSIKILTYGAANEEDEQTVYQFELGEGENEFENYQVLSTNLDASQMGNPISFELYDGEELVEEFHEVGTWTTSIKDIFEQYIVRYAASTKAADVALVNFCKASLSYGGAAQRYFGTITEAEQADENYGVDLNGISSGDIDATFIYNNHKNGIKILGATFMAKEKSAVRFYYELDEGLSLGDFDIVVSMGGEDPEYFGANVRYGVQKRWNGSEYVESEKDVYITVENIPARYLSQEITLTITKDTVPAIDVVYNAMTYAKRSIANGSDSAELCKGLFAMSQAAEAYFDLFAEE